MNIEINFLEKEPNKNIAYILLGIIFIVLLVLAVSVLLFQKNSYDNQLEALESEMIQIESVLLEQQKANGTQRQLEQLEQELIILESEMLPTVEVYHEIIGLLSEPEQLITFDYGTENQLTIDASFPTLHAVADYIAILTEQPYVQDTQLTSSIKMENSYEATLSVIINSEILVEEFVVND
ncbi:hypothetical protein [Oceanobacillus sp. CF4.6]|uniref:hypothetical protein n=1 Tax=Oceanobacillus sp. CF4.6 TaxID=3373080 RepID=UPI003EE57EF0